MGKAMRSRGGGRAPRNTFRLSTRTSEVSRCDEETLPPHPQHVSGKPTAAGSSWRRRAPRWRRSATALEGAGELGDAQTPLPFSRGHGSCCRATRRNIRLLLAKRAIKGASDARIRRTVGSLKGTTGDFEEIQPNRSQAEAIQSIFKGESRILPLGSSTAAHCCLQAATSNQATHTQLKYSCSEDASLTAG
ncbi:hypothetical protein AGIG_G7979 [Arapaima gigas]